MQPILEHSRWIKRYMIAGFIAIIALLIGDSLELRSLGDIFTIFGYIFIIISCLATIAILYAQSDEMKKVLAKEIETHEDFLSNQIKKIKNELIRLSFEQLNEIKKDPNYFIQHKSEELLEAFYINDIISPLIQDILKTEFKNQLIKIIESINPLYEKECSVCIADILIPH
ncbi:MAG: hypothetical protein PHW50_02350 [Patescibacteria group bacterium]|nr:hypothetical protein [Patescibacteria group bacterium]